MEANFWHQKWQSNQLGWHEQEINAELVAHLPQLGLPDTATLFVPLCGKTKDIGYLLSLGHQVVAAELSELAVQQLFGELGLTPQVTQHRNLLCYRGDKLTVWVGDIFELSADDVGPIDGCYDRAALIALPSPQRQLYSAHLRALSDNAPQLLITINYDQSTLAPPPFSLDKAEVHAHYDGYYRVELVAEAEVEGGLKGKVPAQQRCWLLHRK